MSAASAVLPGVLLGLVLGLSPAGFAVVRFAIKERLHIRRTLAAFDREFPRLKDTP